jgi:NAD(P)-dependent dehydrogenase (short-subunit alcohol dehydrogenase family)
MENLFSVKNKVIIITGAAGDIGFKLLKNFHNANSIVYGLDKNMDIKQKKLFKNNFIQCDLTKNIQIEKIFKNIFLKHKKIDVLINAAGVTFPLKKSTSIDIKSWQNTFDVNLNSVYYSCMSAIKYMKKNKHGSIINITSINAELGFPSNPSYIASKGALKMLSKSLAKDYGKYGIRVNNLGPGYIITKMTKKSFNDKKSNLLRQKHTLLNRWGTPDDLVGPTIFLASESSKYVTGHDLYVDGGWLANGLISE